MRRLVIFLLLILVSELCYSQNMRDLTIVQGFGDDLVNVFPSEQGVLFAGSFSSNAVVMGPETLYASNGFGDMFVGMLNESLTDIVWIRSFGGDNVSAVNERCAVVGATEDGFLVSGRFGGTFSIDQHQVAVAGVEDAFLAKFDYTGNCQWLISAGGSGVDNGGPVAITDNDKILWFVYGEDEGSIDAFQVSKGGYLVTLDSDGHVESVRDQFTNAFRIVSFALSGSSLYCSGQTRNDTASFDSISWISSNVQDIAIAKCDLTGSAQWVRCLGSGRSGSGANQLRLDSEGSVYVTGYYFDSLVVDGNVISSPNGGLFHDVFIARFDSNGTNQWLVNGRSDNSIGMGLSFDSDSSFYVIGQFYDTLSFGSNQVYSLESNSLFLARFNLSGICIGVYTHANCFGNTVTMDLDGYPIISGIFYDSIEVQGTTYVSWGQRDAFIGRMDKITGIAPEARMGQDGLVIYANPNDGTFRIKVPASVVTLQGASLRVYDARGGLVEQFELGQAVDTPILRLKHVTSGQYVVRLEQGGRVYSGKMVVE